MCRESICVSVLIREIVFDSFAVGVLICNTSGDLCSSGGNAGEWNKK